MRLLCYAINILTCYIFISVDNHLTAQQYYPIRQDQKWGLIDGSGKITVDPIYDAIGDFYQFDYAVVQRNGKVGIINSMGKIVLPVQYEDLQVLDSLVFAVVQEKRWQVIDATGRIVLDNDYEKVKILHQEYIAYSKEGKWGLTHLNGTSITSPKYDDITTFGEQYFQIEYEGKLGLLHPSGRVVIQPLSTRLVSHGDSLFFYYRNKKWGLTNAAGENLLFAKWTRYQFIDPYFIQLSRNGKSHLYAIETQKIITTTPFDHFISFSKKHIIFKIRDQLGLLDNTGKEVLPCEFDEILPLNHTRFRVRKGTKWGIVDAASVNLLKFDYDYISPSYHKVCLIRQQGLFGLVNLHGEIIAAPRYSSIQIEKGRAKAFQNKLLTLVFFDNEGRKTTKSVVGQQKVIRIKKKSKKKKYIPTDGDEIDYQLAEYEWFYSAKADRWGLRHLKTGEIRIKPTFHTVLVKKDLGFTIVGIKKGYEQEISLTNFEFEYAFGLVNNEHGLLVTDMNITDIRLEDFEKKHLNAARCIFTNGTHGIIRQDGKIIRKDYTYIGEFINGIARASARGRLVGDKTPDYPHLGKVSSYYSQMMSPNEMSDYTNDDQDFLETAWLTCALCEWGFIDTAGKEIVAQQYRYIYDLSGDIAIAQDWATRKWGVIDTSRRILLHFEYDDLYYLNNSQQQILRLRINNKKYGLIDTLGKSVIPVAFDEIGTASENLIPVKQNGYWGYANLSGKLVIPCQYERAKSFHEGLAAVRLNHAWGFISPYNNVVIPIKYNSVGDFRNGIAWFKEKYAYGYLDKNGKIAIEAVYEDASDFNNGVARIKRENKWGLIATNGNEILKPKYRVIYPFNEHGIAKVLLKNSYYSFINRQGERVTNQRFKKTLPFQEGFAPVYDGDDWGFIDNNGNLVIKPQYSKVQPFNDGRASVRYKGRWGYIDRAGNWIIPPQFTRCMSYQDGRAVVYKGMKNAGLIDLEGNYIIEPSIYRMMGFNDGRGLVRDGKYRFYYITENNRLYKGYYQNAGNFHDGVAAVQQSDKWGLINQRGIELIAPKYDRIDLFENGYAKVRITQFSGVADLRGNIIAPPHFENITYAGNGVFRVEEGDKIGYINQKGEWIWTLQR